MLLKIITHRNNCHRSTSVKLFLNINNVKEIVRNILVLIFVIAFLVTVTPDIDEGEECSKYK